MKKDRHKRRSRTRQRPAKPRQDRMELAHHPISGVDRKAFQEAMLAIGKKRAEEFPSLVQTVLDQFRGWYPPHLVAVVAGWGLHAAASDSGVSMKRMIKGIEQHHVELLQALMLNLDPDEWGSEPAPPWEIQKTIDAVIALAEAFHQRRYVAMEEERDVEARTVIALQELLRSHTQMVRNWGYFSDVVRLSTELYGHFDEPLKAHHGFSATDLVEVCRLMVSMLEERHTERFVTIKKIFRARSIRQLVRLYFERYPGVAGDPEDFLSSLEPGEPEESVRLKLLSHADNWFVKLAIVPVDELAARSGRDRETVVKVLEAISLEPGALVSENPEHFFMASPVWRAPVLKDGGAYFAPTPQVVFSHIHDVMRPLLHAAGLKDQIEARRARFLEAKLEAIIRSVMPTADVRPNVKWQGFETDVLAVLDRVVVIAEAKSARLTAEGLRGAPDRVRRHVRDLIVDPSVQSARLEELIWKAKDGDAEALAVMAELSLDAGQVDTVVRLNVTLDDFSILSSSELRLKGAGWVPSDLRLAPTLNIADLGCVAELLSDPLFFIHYLSERGRLQKTTDIFGDELDYLGFYLETGLNLGDLEKEGYDLSISGMSKTVDQFFINRDAGITTRKPHPKVHPYFMSVLAEIETKAIDAWTTMGLDLLRAGNLHEQGQAVRAMEQLRKDVAKTFRDPHHISSVILIPPSTRDGLILVYVYPEAIVSGRREAVHQLTSEALEQHGRQRCVVIGRKIEAWDRPYGFIGLASAPKEAADADDAG